MRFGNVFLHFMRDIFMQNLHVLKLILGVTAEAIFGVSYNDDNLTDLFWMTVNAPYLSWMETLATPLFLPKTRGFASALHVLCFVDVVDSFFFFPRWRQNTSLTGDYKCKLLTGLNGLWSGRPCNLVWLLRWCYWTLSLNILWKT